MLASPIQQSTCDLSAEITEAQAPESLLDYLIRHRLNRKLVDIAIAETHLPYSLKEEASQEILLSWHKARALPKYNLSETASYAHMIAKTAALRVRRELGSVVRLPGSAFQQGSAGRTFLTPGILAAPLELSDSDAENVEVEQGALSLLSGIDPLQILEVYNLLTLEEAEIMDSLLLGNSIYLTAMKLKLSRRALQVHLNEIIQVAQKLGLYQD